jgi:hypothetical protein
LLLAGAVIILVTVAFALILTIKDFKLGTLATLFAQILETFLLRL